MKKLIALLLTLAMCLSIVACGSSDTPAVDTPVADAPTADAPVPEGVVEIIWWTNYGSSNVVIIQELIDEFNESQDQYHVTIERQGGASELKAKLRSTKAENMPTMFSGTPATTSFYANSDFTYCFQDLLDADSEDWAADLYSAVRTSYCDTEGKMWGFPFGVSCTGIWVNEDILQAAGYTVDDITSFVKLCQIAKDITKGGYATYGMGFHKDGDYINNMMALEGVDAVDNGNGYTDFATRSLYTEGATNAALTEALTAYADLYVNGAAMPFGNDVNGEIIPSFVSGDVAMFFATNSYAAKMLSYESNIRFTFIPIVGLTENAAHTGVISSGTGNYICASASEAEKQGAYEFIKFLAQAEQQAYWCEQTGYVPYTQACSDYESYKTWMNENFPAAEKLLADLLATDGNLKLPYISVATDQLNANVLLMEQLYVDPAGDIQAFLEEAATTVNEALEIAALTR